MDFLLQQENNVITDTEIFNLKQLLDKQKYQHRYSYVGYDDIINLRNPSNKEMIPIGTLQYVGRFLKQFYNIEHLNPIEVPNCLREERYLKRKYSIINKDDLPSEGRYFIKYASSLKEFTYIGNILDLGDEPSDVSPYKKEGLYQISEIVDIESEYRVFVYRDEIQAIQYYDGDCTVFPDANLIKEMVFKYSLDSQRPLAYTIDIAVIKNRGTCVLEVHPFVSVGTYGFNRNPLPYMYRLGLDYYININKELEVYK